MVLVGRGAGEWAGLVEQVLWTTECSCLVDAIVRFQ